MPQRRPLLAALACLTACGSPAAPAEPTKAAPGPEPAVTEPAKAEPVVRVAPKPNEPGPAYFVVERQGVVRLQDGVFERIEGAPAESLHSLQLGPDGAPWLLGGHELLRLDGDRFVRIAKVDEPARHLAIDPEGGAWITSRGGVARWHEGAWTSEPREWIGPGDDAPRDLAVDRDGRVWVLSAARLHSREAAGLWRDVDLASALAIKGPALPRDLEVGPEGTVHLLAHGALYRNGPTPGQFTRVDIGADKAARPGQFKLSRNGSVGALEAADVYHVPANGSPRRYSSRGSRDFTADNIRAVAPDDAGRLWVASDLGVSVIVPGAARVQWPPGSVPALVGEVTELLIVGAGPKDLPPPGPVARGKLTGTVVRAGEPVADAAIELCPGPIEAAKPSPCHDAKLRFTAKTDAAGMWLVEGAPIADYGLAVAVGKKAWHIEANAVLGSRMTADDTLDTGTRTLDAP